MPKIIRFVAVAAAALFAATAANAATAVLTFSSPGNYWGSADLDVTSGTAVSGTGTLHIAGDPAQTLTLLTATQEFNDGTVLSIGNNAWPLSATDPNDYLVFAVGPDTTNFKNDAGLYVERSSPQFGLFGKVNGTEYYQYSGVAGVVPEPATWATLILGLGMAGVVLRRRGALATA